MKIEVKTSEVRVKSGNAKRTGKPYTIREQEAYLHVPGAAYPERCVLNLEGDQEPYAPGIYETSNELSVSQAFAVCSYSASARVFAISTIITLAAA